MANKLNDGQKKATAAPKKSSPSKTTQDIWGVEPTSKMCWNKMITQKSTIRRISSEKKTLRFHTNRKKLQSYLDTSLFLALSD